VTEKASIVVSSGRSSVENHHLKGKESHRMKNPEPEGSAPLKQVPTIQVIIEPTNLCYCNL
jgi:hypothetical protein